MHLQERVEIELNSGQTSQPLPSPFNLIAEQGGLRAGQQVQASLVATARGFRAARRQCRGARADSAA